MSAIYLSEYASRRMRSRLKPLLEILAGIPTVVYGFFAALPVAPLLLSLIHISEPTRLLSISYAVFCLKKKTSYTRYYSPY